MACVAGISLYYDTESLTIQILEDVLLKIDCLKKRIEDDCYIENPSFNIDFSTPTSINPGDSTFADIRNTEINKEKYKRNKGKWLDNLEKTKQQIIKIKNRYSMDWPSTILVRDYKRLCEYYVNTMIGNLTNYLSSTDGWWLLNDPEYQYHDSLLIQIALIEELMESKGTIVIVGENGVGKSSFIQALKGTDYGIENHIEIIPAQKSLFFYPDQSSYTINPQDYRTRQRTNLISDSKAKEDNYSFLDYQKSQFAALLQLLFSDSASRFHFIANKGPITSGTEEFKQQFSESLYIRLVKLYKAIFPDIEILPGDSLQHPIVFSKKGSTYNVNALSEGEKTAIYYCLSVFLAPSQSFIVVDEANTHLNSGLACDLWNYLIKGRKDCQFLFVTHDTEFATRINCSDLFWIKDYEYPNNWLIERIKSNFDLPPDLITRILGTSKPIVFCEGDENSKDFKLYQSWFNEFAYVIPCGGHPTVIARTKAVNQMQWTGKHAIGIIDGDNYSEETKMKWKDDHIYILNCNEIEMIYLYESVILEVLKLYPGSNSKEKLAAFKTAFFEKLKERRQHIISEVFRQKLNEMLSSYRFDSNINPNAVRKELSSISDSIEDLEKEISSKIDTAIDSNDYLNCLKICNLKREILPGLTKKHLCNDYADLAEKQLMDNRQLQRTIIDTFLPGIAEEFQNLEIK